MKKLFLLLPFCLLGLLSHSQLLDSMLRVYADLIPDEKIHVHFDKDIYTAGETVWFKAYLLSGFSLSIKSKNFYAELINDKGSIIQRKVFPVSEATASGSFDLADAMPSGNYLFRGYTTWMLNFDTAFLFQKNITITDKTGSLNKQKKNEPTETFIQFFPEGGNLVNGLESVVAFKANDDKGLPVLAKGNIVSNTGNVMKSFTSVHDGMGTFAMTPVAGETYKAEWTDNRGKIQTTDLPVARNEGLVLKLTNTGTGKLFSITRTDAVPEDWKKVTIIAMLGQQTIYKAKADLSTTTTTAGAIPVQNIPSGIMQVTVLSDNNEPIAERIIMVNNNDYLFPATLHTLTVNTAVRAKNAFEIEVPDTLLTNMSVAVTDAALGRQVMADNIVSRALVTGDIKGYVHNPAYYFSNSSDSVAKHLDLVLLTHGWRKYNWPLLAKGKLPTLKFPEDQYLSLDAKVFGITPYSPLRKDEELIAFIQAKDSSRQSFEILKTGPDKFSFPNVFYYDTVSVFYDFVIDKKAGSGMTISFNNNLYKGVKNISTMSRIPDFLFDTTLLTRTKIFAERMARYKRFDDANVLATVTVKTKVQSRAKELDDKYTSSLFKTDNAEVFDFTEQPATGADVLSYLKGRVAGLQIKGFGSSAQLSWRGATPALYLNEMPADAQTISTVPVTDIALVKVIRPPFMLGGSASAGGAIAIYTKKGENAKSGSAPGAGMNKTRVVGYAYPKEFYSPNYKDMTARSETPADFRSTLYWNPFILTDRIKQKARFEFYNNDITKAFRIVIEGVNEAGKVIRIEKVVQQD